MSRQLVRKLSALGYEYRGEIKVAGFGCLKLADGSGKQLLAVLENPFGLSWPAIHSEFRVLGLEVAVLQIDGTVVLVLEASRKAINELEGLAGQIKTKASRQLYISGVGFVATEQKQKLNPKSLILPLTALLSTLLMVVIWPKGESLPLSTENEKSASCALDLSPKGQSSWILEKLNSDSKTGDVLSHSSELGQLELQIVQALGTAISATGTISCSDGRKQAISFRADLSGKGFLIPLGQKLDP